jgi:pseudomonalisin
MQRRTAAVPGIRFIAVLLLLGFATVGVAPLCLAQVQASRRKASPRIVQRIDENRRVVLTGNIHALARPQYDRGAAPADLPLDRLQLVLKRSPEQQTQLDRLLIDQQQPDSPDYHRWLTPEEFGERFGPADEDIQKLSGWLESHGFRVDEVAAGRGTIEFSGSAAQLEEAFHAPMHKFVVDGKEHWANAGDPEIPAALAEVVDGVANLHSFFSQPLHVVSPRDFSGPGGKGAHPFYSQGWYYNALAPADFAVIYNLNSLYQAGINGAGATIAVIGRTNISVSDVNDFRRLFGLSVNPPQIVLNGADPGDLGGGEEVEALLDNSWAGAVAPSATVKFVVSASTNTSDGTMLSEQYIINHNSTLGADVMTESFGLCEGYVPASYGTMLSGLAQQAAAEGITYMVSTGDTGSAGCDYQGETAASGPLSVNVLGSSPYVTAVGGTQFNETAGSGPYWSGSSMNPYYLSVYSYIPENVWNQSCAASNCGNPNIIAGAGGASAFFSKPSWQSGVAGIPADGARDVPDVSLAASGAHDPYLLCIRGACSQSQSTPGFSGVGGTSASAPAFAGIMALVKQKAGARQGAVNSILYQLAASEQLSQCNASTGIPGATCIFNDVTAGDNAVPGEAGYGTGSATYKAGVGYDRATGLGSVNGANLVNHWTSVTTNGIALSPLSVAFSSQAPGTTSGAQTVTILNNGSTALTISGIALSGANSNQFAQTNTCGASLSAGASCTVSITFRPTVAGTMAASLTVTDTAAGSPQSVSLSGVAAVPTPVISSLNPSPMTGSASSQTLTINGSGFQTGLTVVAGYTGSTQTLTGAAITSLTSTQIQVSINVGTTARVWAVGVVNPGGVSSNIVAWQVNAPVVAPVITSFNPSPMTGSASNQTLTINGSGFQSGAGLTVIAGYTGNVQSIAGAAITSATSTQIQVSINVGITARTWAIAVMNPSGTASNIVTLQVNAPPVAPVITSLSPSPMTGSASNQTLTINGSGFQPGLVVLAGYTGSTQTLSGSAITSLTSTQVQVSINVGTTARVWAVGVINPGGVSSNVVAWQVNAPSVAPVITSLSPSPMTGSASNQTLTINGSGFQSGAGLTVVAGYASNVQGFSGSAITSVTSTQIQVSINVGTTARAWAVAVVNPNGVASNTVVFQVNAPAAAPVITSVSPSPMTASASNQTLTINGTGFQSGAGLTVVAGYSGNVQGFSGSAITSVTSTQIRVTINVGTTPRAWAVTVVNPGGVASNTVVFQVN